MARQNINVGSSPNDGSGTGWRTAFQMINEMFQEVYEALGTFATVTQLNTEATTRSAAIADINTQLAGKASADSVSSKASADSVIRKDTPQANANALRFQFAQNAGSLTRFAYDLIEDTDPVADGSWKLPPFPAGFYLTEAALVVKNSQGGGTLTGSISIPGHGDPVLWTGAVFPDGGANPGAVANATVTAFVVEAAKELEFTLDDHSVNGTGGSASGLVLWLGGVWAQ